MGLSHGPLGLVPLWLLISLLKAVGFECSDSVVGLPWPGSFPLKHHVNLGRLLPFPEPYAVAVQAIVSHVR